MGLPGFLNNFPTNTNKEQTVSGDGEPREYDQYYLKTLNAYQNDLDQLNKITHAQEVINTRIKQHQSILSSLQGSQRSLQGR